ncbi:MAG: Ig-like domain-containing protein [Clostridiales bacterium]|nr:Ig-like domain-containing protein [Clostridiales bacterium]
METYRLAVCEDEKNVREEIQGLCDSILRDMRIKGDITAFASAQELERELDGGQEFDTLILDIEMEEKEMSVDDSFPLDGLHVEGVNADKVAYYGFDENDGHWVLTDAEGKVLTSNKMAEITEDKLTGRKTLTAKEAGTVYLKWMLNDGVKYTSKNDATVISSDNFDTPLVDTAYIKIDIEEIPFAGSIDVNGSYEGTVNAEPVNLNDVLSATVYDESGKEVVRPLTWEARQLDGITVEPGGDVTFEKEGTYQVRAVISDEVRSDWVNVHGGEKPFEGSVVLTGSYTGTVGAAADDLNTKLDVRVFDTDKKQVDRPVTWEASELNGIKVTEDGKVTFTKPGTYHVQARVSDTIKSGWYAIKAVNPDTTIAVTGVTLSGAEKLSVGESVALTTAVAPANATDQALTFTSSSADVIKVDNSGRVTALKPGRATVTVTAAGGKKASMQITVTVRE